MTRRGLNSVAHRGPRRRLETRRPYNPRIVRASSNRPNSLGVRVLGLTLLASIWPGGVSRSGEPEILELLGRSFQAPLSSDQLQAIEADPAFRRERLSGWLHRAAVFSKPDPGLVVRTVEVLEGQRRGVVLRIPDGYDPTRPWPLILAYHPSGGSGGSFIDYVARLLGDSIDDFVVAAPTRYRQTGMDAPPPFTNEHAMVLNDLRKTLHIDSNRIHVLGYSLGGYTAWNLAMTLPDELAGAVALASTFPVPIADDGVWELFVPNLGRVPVLHVWGTADRLAVPGVGGGKSVGTIAQLNARFRKATAESSIGVTHRPVERATHGDLRPRRSWLLDALASRRGAIPGEIEHRYRHLYQGRVWWLEATGWIGESWQPAPKETSGVVASRLGLLKGRIHDNRIQIAGEHATGYRIRFADGMIDWDRPVDVIVEGEAARRIELRPGLAFALEQVALSGDLDRLWWAGWSTLPHDSR